MTFAATGGAAFYLLGCAVVQDVFLAYRFNRLYPVYINCCCTAVFTSCAVFFA